MLCPHCNANVPDGSAFCENCGAALTAAQPASGAAVDSENAHYQQSACVQADQQSQQGYQQPGYQQPQAGYVPPVGAVPAGTKSKIAAGLLGIFLGSLGIHKFYLGYTQAGIIMLVITLVGGIFTFGVAALVMDVIGIVEGIMYLVKSDWEFYQTYEVGQKQWF